jgi:glycosyltransferase involved in cell wall biosynthesis
LFSGPGYPCLLSDSRRLSFAALVPYALGTTPSQRFRLEQWQPFLAQKGIDLRFVPFAGKQLTSFLPMPGHTIRKGSLAVSSFLRQAWQTMRIGHCDGVIVHRAAALGGPPILERWMRSRRRPFIYDFDDAIFLLHRIEANRGLAWFKFPGKTATLCRLADHATTGNSFLADFARRHTARVTVVPSSVDTDLYCPRPRVQRDGLPVIGWMGTSSSQTHLELFAPMLRRLAATRRIELRVVSNRQPQLPGISHIWRPWAADKEVEELNGFDIGIMPMPDDEWSRGKGAFKALQYMSMSVSTVASAVGANRDVIEDGLNGLLAANDDDWISKIGRLIDDPAERTRLGAAGRRTVEERYAASVSAARFETVLRETVELWWRGRV